MKRITIFFISIMTMGVSNFLIAQESNLSGVLKFKPVINKSTASKEVCKKLYNQVLKSLDDKNRFVAFAEGVNEPKDVAASVLVDMTITSFGVSQKTIKPKKPKDAPANWKSPGDQVQTNSNISAVLNFTDVATGKKLEPKAFKGIFEETRKKTAIKRENLSWSKDKGLHNTKKSGSDIKEQQKKVAKEVAAWKVSAGNKAVENAFKNWKVDIRKILPVEVNIKSIAESKKNKAVRLMIDAGKDKDIDNTHRYDVVELTSYEVGGKKLEKETKLGLIWVWKGKFILENESNFKVGKGKKAIFQAINEGKKLALRLK